MNKQNLNSLEHHDFRNDPIFTKEDRRYIRTKVTKAFKKMETHVEIFDLPSGIELWVYCDGSYRIGE